jgi:hypothetical protein
MVQRMAATRRAERLRAFLQREEFDALVRDPGNPAGRAYPPVAERLEAVAGPDPTHDATWEAVRRLCREDDAFLADYWRWVQEVAKLLAARGFPEQLGYVRTLMVKNTRLPLGELASRLGWALSPQERAQVARERREREQREAAQRERETALRKWLHGWLTADPRKWEGCLDGEPPGKGSLQATEAWLKDEVESAWQAGEPWSPPGLAPVPRPHWWEPRPVCGLKELPPADDGPLTDDAQPLF